MNRHTSRSGAPSSPRAVAPFHRGPAAVAAHAVAHNPAPPPSQMVYAPNAALLIDFDNVTMGIRSDLQEELKNLLSSDIIKGKVAVRRAYADWRRYQQYVVPLTEASIDLIFAPAYGSSKKNATDIRLAIDALELVFTRPEIGTFVLLSGDSDFSSMVIKLKEYGKYVIGVGIRESSSDLLVMNCDEYYSYNALAGLVRSGEDETTRWDPWELATEAVARMKRNGDVMRSDRLKQVMQDIDASFDEKNLGYPKFSRFVLEAQTRNLLRVSKLESGQLEVDAVEHADGEAASPQESTSAAADSVTEADGTLASAASTAGAQNAKAEHAEGEREERRSRRGRRGGRGRDRRDKEREEVAGTAATEPSAQQQAAVDALSTDSAVVGEGEVSLPQQESSALVDPVGIRPLPSDASEKKEKSHSAQGKAANQRSNAIPASLPAPFDAPVSEDVGRSGERLTRTDAFELVRKAVESLVSGDAFTSASMARQRAFELLGRNSESLSVRMFERVLQDAHDAGLIDLRRRGNDWEVARVAEAQSIVDQLKSADEAQKAQDSQKLAKQPPLPRGMSARGIGGRASNGRGKEIPPGLLMVGVVAPVGSIAASKAAPAAVAAPAAAASVADAKTTPEKQESAPKQAIAETAAPNAAPNAAGSASKAENKTAIKAGANTAKKPAPKPAGRSVAKAANKTVAKAANSSASKTAAKTANKAAASKASKAPAKAPAKTAAKPAVKSAAKSVSKSAAKPAAKKTSSASTGARKTAGKR